MSITTLEELYSSMAGLAEQLREVGEEQWSTDLRYAMYGSTSGEVLSQLEVQLAGLERSAATRRLGLEKTVADALTFINATLNLPGHWRPPTR